jgi:phospholipid/cholesterol/gamma-HCH transport system substrate-binding protein
MAYKFKSMEKIIGIFIVVALLSVLSFVIMIGRGKNFFVKKNWYYTYFDNGEGISKGLNIFYKGVKIGLVTDVSLNTDDRIYTKFYVFREYGDKVKVDSVARFTKPILGSGSIRISRGAFNSQPLPNNSYMISYDTEQGKTLFKLNKMEGDNIDKIVGNMEEMTSPEGALVMTLSHLQTLTKSLNEFTKNMNQITGNIAGNKDQINDIILNLRLTSANLVVVTRNLRQNRLIGGRPEKEEKGVIPAVK